MPWQALDRYLDFTPATTGSCTTATSSPACSYPEFEHVRLPFDIDLSVAQHPCRLCNQPCQKALKLLGDRTRARGIRYPQAVAA